jgi:gliding motility-associated-like protein
VNGCSGTASVTVTVHQNPVITSFAGSSQPSAPQICQGDSVLITAYGGNNYSWGNNMGTSQSQLVSPTLTTTYYVTGTDTNGCTGSAQVTVIVHENPVVLILPVSPKICQGDTAFLTASGASDYIWNTGQNFETIHVSPSINTPYSVTGTDLFGCSGTADVTVTVIPSLICEIDPLFAEICVGEIVELTAISSGNPVAFSWSTGDNAPVIIVNPNTTTTYTVVMTDDFGCSGSASTTVLVKPLPAVDLEAFPNSGCPPLSVHFVNLSSPGTVFWNFGDGGVSSAENPVHTYSNSGLYDVSLKVVHDGCMNFIEIPDYIHVYPDVAAGFSYSGNSEYDNTIYFTDLSTGASLWYWDFGTGLPGSISTIQNPSYTFTEEGQYTVWQIVQNQWECVDSASINIPVKPIFVSFYIPNAFSPNGDGTNDEFMTFGHQVDPEHFEMLIFNRWGQQLFRTDNPNTPWKGTFQNQILPTGVYIYLIRVRLNGVDKEFNGTVTLVY